MPELEAIDLHGGVYILVPNEVSTPPAVVLRELRLWTRPEVAETDLRGGGLPPIGGPLQTLLEFVAAGLVGNAAYDAFPSAVRYLKALVSSHKAAKISSAEELGDFVRKAAPQLIGHKPTHVVIVEAGRDGEFWHATCRVDEVLVAIVVDASGSLLVWQPTT